MKRIWGDARALTAIGVGASIGLVTTLALSARSAPPASASVDCQVEVDVEHRRVMVSIDGSAEAIEVTPEVHVGDAGECMERGGVEDVRVIRIRRGHRDGHERHVVRERREVRERIREAEERALEGQERAREGLERARERLEQTRVRLEGLDLDGLHEVEFEFDLDGLDFEGEDFDFDFDFDLDGDDPRIGDQLERMMQELSERLERLDDEVGA